MLALSRATDRCIQCAYRHRLLVFQQQRQRQRHATALKRLKLDDPFKKLVLDQGVKRVFVRGTIKLNKLADILKKHLNDVKKELEGGPVYQHIQHNAQAGGDDATKSFAKTWNAFAAKAHGSDDRDVSPSGKGVDSSSQKLRSDILSAYRTRGEKGLSQVIKQAFYHHVFGSSFTDNDIKNQKALADLRYPNEWYPATRVRHRTIHMHVGPTNSGKTYQALLRLEQADRGLYAGPLRLLAHEVYTRMNAKGRPCSLITGEERRMPNLDGQQNPSMQNRAGNCDMSSCTVEMIPLNKDLDVAVIDEIQMIGNAERGWAWTQALLGIKAAEVHLCGEERAVPLIKQLCASNGDKLEIHKYERLSPLEMADHSLEGDLGRLRKGDCIVSFSIMGIHALRKQIEQRTGRKVATVYGSLPPETRAQQARLFNDPNNDYDFLVASDAVGMGLNLAIKRIIFESSSKFDGMQRRTLPIADIKQIAGRAGRYRTAEQSNQQAASQQELAAAKGDSPPETVDESGEVEENVGIVTTLDQFDFPIVAAAMQSEPEPIKTAGIYPPSSILERFASYFPPGTPFSYILMRLFELSQMHSRFHLCGIRDLIAVADMIEPVKGLSVGDRNVICAAPASHREEMWRDLMPAFARCIAEQTNGHLADIRELPLEILEAPVSPSRQYLNSLERLHKAIVCYLWLSYRFAGVFNTRALAFHVKVMVEQRIEEVLSKFSFSETQRRKLAEQRQKQLLRYMLEPASVDEIDADGNVIERLAKDDAEDEESDAIMEGSDRVPRTAEELQSQQVDDEQTSLTAGGDQFGGGDELELGDPADRDVLEEEPAAARTFAEWRQQQQQKGLARWADERRESGIDELVPDLDRGEQVEQGSDTPTLAEAMPELVVDSEAASSEDQSDEAGFTSVKPATEVSDDKTLMESQIVPRKADESDSSLDISTSPKAGEGQFGGGIVPKHLSELQTHATEMERDVASRP
ncbi:Mitochondrial degradasome RNA helicase subunit C terminal [Teratosphaeria destructans]|uniref:RNA helicase n=1 Tax=Teratosphaeria destructans TaxID=418781 RepID=A0A9W7SIF7_9PEZI|nr:Mitochondrial degradasome RNA helicase subunit C terminal [Teratosphaeria destructans]